MDGVEVEPLIYILSSILELIITHISNFIFS